jgi:hypothetical protein
MSSRLATSNLSLNYPLMLDRKMVQPQDDAVEKVRLAELFLLLITQ